MSTRKLRRTRLDWQCLESRKSWSNSTLNFGEWRGKTKHEVVLRISDPASLQCIRQQLDEIEAHWREQIERVEP